MIVLVIYTPTQYNIRNSIICNKILRYYIQIYGSQKKQKKNIQTFLKGSLREYEEKNIIYLLKRNDIRVDILKNMIEISIFPTKVS